MMHALTPAADLDVSVRARRLTCVLDPALLLAAPHLLLLTQQLARSVDLWVCPGFWRLLDASVFFCRRPARLRSWLALSPQHPEQQVGAAVACWSRWRVSRDLTALGLYWVGGHQTESFLPEQGPRDLPMRFEALVEAWMRANDVPGREAVLVAAGDDGEHEAAATTVRPLRRIALEPDPDDDARCGPGQRHEGVLEAAALAVALQAPVLTVAANDDGPPALVRQWMEGGLAASSLESVHAAAAAAERQRWWDALVASGAAATVAAVASLGVGLAIAHVVAPASQLLVPEEGGSPWLDDLGGASWGDEAPEAAALGLPAREAPPWWRDAQALWTRL
jgi:hypothetical protein